ncbi:MAG: hypothetical protein LBT59_05530 [Clostridiales bacterium]|jgi:hypothetical protein|nr:hypothetical protein [Clostridiales bacterium]
MQGEQLVRKVPKSAAIAIAIIAAAGIVSTAFAMDIAKKVVPGYYCAQALGSLAGEIPSELGSGELGTLFGAPWGAEVVVELDDMSAGKPGYMQLIDDSAVKLFKMLGTRLEVGMSPETGRASGRLLLDLSGKPLLDVELWASLEVLSARFKELADYYIEIDPRQFASDWNISAFSGIAEIAGEDSDSAFFSRYQKILDAIPKNAKKASIPWKPAVKYKDLAQGAKFSFLEKVAAQTSDGEAKADKYRATLKAESVDAWVSALSAELAAYSTNGFWQDADDFLAALEGASFEEDVILNIEVIDGRLLSLAIEKAKMGSSDLAGSMKFPDQSGYFKDAAMLVEISGEKPARFESSLKVSDGKGALSLSGSSPEIKATMEAEKEGSQYKAKLEIEKEKSPKTSKTILETNFDVKDGSLKVSIPNLRLESKEDKGQMFAQFKAEASIAPKAEPEAQKPANSKFIYSIWDADLIDMQIKILGNEALLSVLNNDF